MQIRNQSTLGAVPGSLPPLSRVHQRLFQQQVNLLEQNGQDTTMLLQLLETLPRLRNGLSSTERQRIDELDRNADELVNAWKALDSIMEQYQALGIVTDAQLISVEQLSQKARCLQDCAEACSEAALRLQSRLRLLEAE